MSISIHRASVGAYTYMLEALAGVLDKAGEFAAARGMSDEQLLSARLYPDMLPLSAQVQLASDHAKGSTSRIAGIEQPVYEDNEKTLDELKARVAKTLDYIKTITPEKLKNAAAQKVTIELFNTPLEFTGEAYLLHFAHPNFYFHVTTAFDILRAMGVHLGKADFMGNKLIQE